jgi:voltage-gated potassium channel
VTGRNAARELLDHGTDPTDLIVIDTNTNAIEQATAFGAHTILGDGTHRHVLAQATDAGCIRHVIVAVVPDETALLTTMHARDLCPTATIATALRESAHIPFARRHGADHVINTAEAAGTAMAHAVHHAPAADLGRPRHRPRG